MELTDEEAERLAEVLQVFEASLGEETIAEVDQIEERLIYISINDAEEQFKLDRRLLGKKNWTDKTVKEVADKVW